jgi:hypothetical protein
LLCVVPAMIEKYVSENVNMQAEICIYRPVERERERERYVPTKHIPVP